MNKYVKGSDKSGDKKLDISTIKEIYLIENDKCEVVSNGTRYEVKGDRMVQFLLQTLQASADETRNDNLDMLKAEVTKLATNITEQKNAIVAEISKASSEIKSGTTNIATSVKNGNADVADATAQGFAESQPKFVKTVYDRVVQYANVANIAYASVVPNHSATLTTSDGKHQNIPMEAMSKIMEILDTYLVNKQP